MKWIEIDLPFTFKIVLSFVSSWVVLIVYKGNKIWLILLNWGLQRVVLRCFRLGALLYQFMKPYKVFLVHAPNISKVLGPTYINLKIKCLFLLRVLLNCDEQFRVPFVLGVANYSLEKRAESKVFGTSTQQFEPS